MKAAQYYSDYGGAVKLCNALCQFDTVPDALGADLFEPILED